jgi:hypothetical protein
MIVSWAASGQIEHVYHPHPVLSFGFTKENSTHMNTFCMKLSHVTAGQKTTSKSRPSG